MHLFHLLTVGVLVSATPLSVTDPVLVPFIKDRLLGTGGFATVYLGSPVQPAANLPNQAALKCLKNPTDKSILYNEYRYQHVP
jgi:hypothetical protein